MIITNMIAIFLLTSGISGEGATMHTNLPSSVIKTRTTNLLIYSWEHFGESGAA